MQRIASGMADPKMVRPLTTGLAVIDQGIMGLGNFAVVMLVGRQAGPRELGVLTLALTIYYILLAVQESLISHPYTVFANQSREDAGEGYFDAVCWQQGAWSAIVTSVTLSGAFIAFLIGGPNSLQLSLCFALFLPCALFREYARRHLFTEMRISSILQLTLLYVTVLAGSLVVLTSAGEITAAKALIAIALSSMAVGLRWRQITGGFSSVGRDQFRESIERHWTIGRWLFASHIAWLSTSVGTPWIIAGFLGPAATGAFASCDAVLRIVNPIIVGVLNILTPHAAKGFDRGGSEELRRIVLQSMLLLVSVMAALCLVVVVAGDQILALCFGADFAQYSSVLLIVVVTALIEKIAAPTGRGLLVLERTDAGMRGQVAGATVSVVLSLALTPVYGLLGAASALLCGRVVATTIIVLAFRRLTAQALAPRQEEQAHPGEAPQGTHSTDAWEEETLERVV